MLLRYLLRLLTRSDYRGPQVHLIELLGLSAVLHALALGICLLDRLPICWACSLEMQNAYSQKASRSANIPAALELGLQVVCICSSRLHLTQLRSSRKLLLVGCTIGVMCYNERAVKCYGM